MRKVTFLKLCHENIRGDSTGKIVLNDERHENTKLYAKHLCTETRSVSTHLAAEQRLPDLRPAGYALDCQENIRVAHLV